MKITFVLPRVSFNGGIRVVSIYAEQLQKLGHEVFCISLPPRVPSLRQQFSSILKGSGWIRTPDKSPSYFDDIDIPHKILERNRPIVDQDVPDADVVIATWWETAEWVAKLSPSKGAKAYFVQHHEVHDYLPKERSSKTYLLPLHKITISNWLKDLMLTLYNDKNVSLVFNSVDTKQFYVPPRKKQGIPTVGMLYSTAYWKGCNISIQAFNLARQTIPKLQMISFGIHKPSSGLILPDGTQYIQEPKQQNIKDIYASCDVWLCGSYSEGFHLPPLEAMACRCPVVSTKVGGPEDIIENGINGYLVPIGDYVALAEGIVKIIQLPEANWQVMSDAAYKTATSYTWEDATILFEAALLTAIERTKNGDLG